ncbi:kinesin-like protein KIF28P [Hippocampus comes]|uniref:kinesin-like protein KIF28P n=1 Tax=Hippocampus comes TaxID=109280 RepID=UPI00094EA96E|nr:PREDICTED: kinesin-like protein KIF28P [Hippocampus comes]
MHGRDCVKVAVRVRPFNKRERDAGSRCVVTMTASSISIQDPRDSQCRRSFCFDYAYWSHSGYVVQDRTGLYLPEEAGGRYADQECVFQDLGEGILENALQGYNATLLAYGQTGSGKSYSLVGYRPNKGLVPKLCDRLFEAIKENQDTRQCQVFFSMLEIYNEQVVDLLSRGSRPPGGLRVREEQHRGFYVEGLRTVPCDSAAQVEQLMEQGTRTRTTAATHMNTNSSRSHMLIVLQLKQILPQESVTKQSNINLVDLAGSERQRSASSEADRLKEGTAINLSLTTLGNVISTLADMAVGRKVVHVPYRDSVLTKLLQSALGGNSRTVMIATLSPADICYEESLSTLRYAERAKHIQNRPVVNERPTERLVKELKAENARLMQRLSRLGHDGRSADDETKEIRQLLTHNELQIRTIHTLWEQHLQEALRDWEQQYANITQERRMMQMHPYILNINEDAQLSGVVKLFIQEGDWEIGLSEASPRSISIKGLGIQQRHLVLKNKQRRVTLTPLKGSKVTINGRAVSQTTELQHLDRLILGSNCTYLYIGFPSERVANDWSCYDYDYFLSELAAAEGINLGESSKDSCQTDPSILAVFYDYIKLMPLVAEANQMSQELNKGVEFKLEIKNLVLSDSKGHDLEKEIVCRVTSKHTQQVWMWSKAKFVNRKFLMEEIYQQHLDEMKGEQPGEGLSIAALPRDKDPFWDPVEPLLLGTAHLWLQSLAFRIPVDEQLEFRRSFTFSYLRSQYMSGLQGVEFKLEIKNLVLSDSKGHDLEKEIVCRVTSKHTQQVWMWSKAKFVNRKFLMEEIYQQHLDEMKGEQPGEGLSIAALPRDKDPFWDPVEPLLLGTAHLWLQSLAFRIPVDEQLEVLGSEGSEEAILQAKLIPCTSDGLPLGEDDILIDPSELLGRRLDVQLVVEQCFGLRWIRDARSRGIQIGFSPLDSVGRLYTPAVWHLINPVLHHKVHFASFHVSQQLLKHLQSSAMLLELWGLQEGCTCLTSPAEGATVSTDGIFIIDESGMADNPADGVKPNSARSRLQRDLEEQKRVNSHLVKENQRLRGQLNAATNGGDSGRSHSFRPSCDAEFARSLKQFYHNMTSVRAQLQSLRRRRPSESCDLLGLRLFVEEHSGLLKDFSEQLEQSVSALKHDIATIVRRKRERSGTGS